MTKTNLKYACIADLNDFHEYTDQEFLQHQKSIMNGDIGKACQQLSDLACLLNQHIRDEEEFLIPPYQELVPREPAGGAVRFYLREHRQIKMMMDKYVSDLEKWITKPPSEIKLVNQFDSYYKFKELLDHHDARERVFLYRLLDQKLSQPKKDKILSHIKHNMEKIINEI